MNETQHKYPDEITLKELILKIQEYAYEIIGKWWIVAILCTITTLGFLYQRSNFVSTYKADLKFVVEGQSGGGGGLNGLLGSFGINKGSSTNPFKILAVGKSNSILINLLNKKMESGESIANVILSTYKLSDLWSESNPKYKDFSFQEKVNINNTELERKVIKKLRTIVWGNDSKTPLTTFSLDDETGIYSITTNAISEELSLGITNNLYKEIKFFFEEKVFQNQKKVSDILSFKADSLKLLSDQNILNLGQFEDRNQSVISSQILFKKKVLLREGAVLNNAYSEIIKNKEMSDISLKDRQPLFMAIDIPFGPLYPTKSSFIMAIIKGVFIGAFLAIIIILLRKIYLDVMSS